MVLQFLCPNGHKVHCSNDRAGQAAKCPRCGVKFRIPTVEELAASESPASLHAEEAASSAVLTDSKPSSHAIASGIALGPAAGSNEIEFLCPNDHLLHGPAASQGRPGQCPVCGSRFRIPSYSDSAEPRYTDAASGPHLASVEITGTESSAAASGSTLAANPKAASSLHIAESRDIVKHPTAALMERFWKLKAEGATVEIRYGEGHRLTPDEFVRSLCSAAHAVFAVREPNGTLTLTALPWEAVQIVIARGVRQIDF